VTDAAAAAEGLLSRVEEGGQSEEVAEVESALLRRSLVQVTRKPFEPLDELLEIKMNFLFVAMFAPIMPIGIVPTLIARLAEVRFKATKLLWVRRRCWPGASAVLHKTQDIFTHAVVAVATIWHTGLVLVAYNPVLDTWSAGVTVCIWMATAACVFGLIYGLSLVFAHAPGCKRRRLSEDASPARPQKASEGRADDAGIELMSTGSAVEITV